jgi:hypothetical protein
MKSTARIACAAALLLSGCEHPLPVENMGGGQHSLTATSSSAGYYGSREEAVEQANDYCGRSGQRAVTAGFYDKPDIGPHGEHTTSIIFTCAVPKSRS